MFHCMYRETKAEREIEVWNRLPLGSGCGEMDGRIPNCLVFCRCADSGTVADVTFSSGRGCVE